MADMKRCGKCGETLPMDKFNKRTSAHDGYQSRCRDCCRLHMKRNKDKDREYYKEYYEKNAEKRRRYSRDWYWNHQAERLAYIHDYRKQNPELMREQGRARYWANPQKGRDKSARGRTLQTQEHRRAYGKRWRSENLDRLRVSNHKRRALMAGDSFSYVEWGELKQQYEHTCLCCHRKEPDIQLSPDHVIPLSRGGANNIANIQPLCRSCNLRKFTKTTDYRRVS